MDESEWEVGVALAVLGGGGRIPIILNLKENPDFEVLIK